eukprot:5651989-Pyramimonas_sp.AAC.1
MTPSQQAAALQRGLGGLARTIAMRAPPAVISLGVNIGGRHTDGATYIMFLLSTKFENLQEECQLNSWYSTHCLPSPCGRPNRPCVGALRDSPLCS